MRALFSVGLSLIALLAVAAAAPQGPSASTQGGGMKNLTNTVGCK